MSMRMSNRLSGLFSYFHQSVILQTTLESNDKALDKRVKLYYIMDRERVKILKYISFSYKRTYASTLS